MQAGVGAFRVPVKLQFMSVAALCGGFGVLAPWLPTFTIAIGLKPSHLHDVFSLAVEGLGDPGWCKQHHHKNAAWQKSAEPVSYHLMVAKIL